MPVTTSVLAGVRRTLRYLIVLTPAVNYVFYFAVICVATFSALASSRFDRVALQRTALLATAVFLVFFSVKLIGYQSTEDLKEFAKILLFLVLCFLFRDRFTWQMYQSLFLWLLMIDMLFVVLQWTKYDASLFLALERVLHPPHHIEGSLMLQSTRALGIMSDTGEHAIVVFLIYLFFLACWINRAPGKAPLAGLVLGSLILVLAQSKTVIVAFALTLPVVLGLGLRRQPRACLASALAMLALFVSLPDDGIGLLELEQYGRLLDAASGVSSFDARIEIWRGVIQHFENAGFIFQLVGPGRGALAQAGLESSVFDNDYIYILSTYGILGFCCLGSLWLLALKRFAFERSVPATWMLLLLFYVPIIGLGLDCISSLKVTLLLASATACAFATSAAPHFANNPARSFVPTRPASLDKATS